SVSTAVIGSLIRMCHSFARFALAGGALNHPAGASMLPAYEHAQVDDVLRPRQACAAGDPDAFENLGPARPGSGSGMSENLPGFAQE
ncbi:MAG: hypothetical protein ABSA58_03445, partial [Acetobacteraceae bacterium]